MKPAAPNATPTYTASGLQHDDTSTADGRGRHRDWPPHRAEGLRRLAAFAPQMGRDYEAGRNFDHGPTRRAAVSLLSPYVRRRLVSEAELVRAALDQHGPDGAEKFIQEVFWRTYWKGWLELRPGVWRDYRAGVVVDRAAASRGAVAARLAAAEEGRTGIDCFDAWAAELRDTGYLHNHARMWMASIWIFTLSLPWRLGADFFLRHLVDGDPAANTLSFRWVAGLHTVGKHYVADAANIERFTGGRFRPERLARAPAPLVEDTPVPAPTPLPPGGALAGGARAALLITEEDCQPETLGLDLAAIVAVATCLSSSARSDLPVSAVVTAFDRGALHDAGVRAAARGAPAAIALPDTSARGQGDALVDWARSTGADVVITAWVPVGPVRDRLEAARPALEAAGLRLVMLRRSWDDAVWPHAKAGYFKVKERIPTLLREAM